MIHEASRRSRPSAVLFPAREPGLHELDSIVRRDGPLSPQRAVDIVRRAARELAQASSTGPSRVPALGAALFFALTGTAPTQAEAQSPSLLSPHRVPPALDAVVRTCLAREPADRFGSALEVAAALAAISVGEGHALPAG
jgi:hypothetical protein